MYIFAMDNRAVENVVGALALALADSVKRAADARAPEAGQAAAAINLVGIDPGIGIERLRRALGLSHPGAVRLVDRLVQDGMLVRAPGEHDRRAVALSLTVAGETTAQAIADERQSELSRALASLSPGERAAMGVLAAKVLRGLIGSEDYAYSVCRLCNFPVCSDCPVDAELEAEHLHPKGETS